MKKSIIKLSAALFGIFSMVSCAQRGDRTSEMLERLEIGEIPEEVDVYKLLPSESEVEWAGMYVTGRGHNGTIGVKGGSIYVYEGKVLGGFVEIDMNQIVVLDITNPESNARLTGHLKSDDFFSVADHPVSSLQVARFEAIEDAVAGDPNYRVTGNLTIKEITHGIAFDAKINIDGNRLYSTADFDFDRAKYEVRFRSGRFFENLGDNLILDDINLKVNIVAER